MTSLANLPPPIGATGNKANIVVSSFDDDAWGDADNWDFDDIDKKEDLPSIDITSAEYQNKNLNKLSDQELAKHKKAMDSKFEQNFVKPTDPGYVYDKVVDFSKSKGTKHDWDDEGNDDDEYSEDWGEE